MSYRLRPYSELPGILKAAARKAWKDSAEGDGYKYKTLDGALIERIPTLENLGDAYAWYVIDPANLIH